jgi:hypothetical protein
LSTAQLPALADLLRSRFLFQGSGISAAGNAFIPGGVATWTVAFCTSALVRVTATVLVDKAVTLIKTLITTKPIKIAHM